MIELIDWLDLYRMLTDIQNVRKTETIMTNNFVFKLLAVLDTH